MVLIIIWVFIEVVDGHLEGVTASQFVCGSSSTWGLFLLEEFHDPGRELLLSIHVPYRLIDFLFLVCWLQLHFNRILHLLRWSSIAEESDPSLAQALTVFLDTEHIDESLRVGLLVVKE